MVRGHAEPDISPADARLSEDETGQRLVPGRGAAEPGEYVTIVIYGPVRVRADTLDDSIRPGSRLAAGDRGVARALKTVVVEAVNLAESAPTIDIALAAPDEAGLVWVWFNPQ